MAAKLARKCYEGEERSLVTVDEREIRCEGTRELELIIEDRNCDRVERGLSREGFIDEILMDITTSFQSQAVKDILDRSKSTSFRVAYRPSGNGIVERHHWII
ncbi:hypothetical protein SK128_028669 [Halocaridina rubra]|uniref:Uncharacterized protein n=1 Tax=Halocaridina rubra TaxID=373956 RepID=A0AAN9A3X1_HALRR